MKTPTLLHFSLGTSFPQDEGSPPTAQSTSVSALSVGNKRSIFPVFILLDLSAAFATVDCLLPSSWNMLSLCHNTALTWFSSYFSVCSFPASFTNSACSNWTLRAGGSSRQDWRLFPLATLNPLNGHHLHAHVFKYRWDTHEPQNHISAQTSLLSFYLTHWPLTCQLLWQDSIHLKPQHIQTILTIFPHRLSPRSLAQWMASPSIHLILARNLGIKPDISLSLISDPAHHWVYCLCPLLSTSTTPPKFRPVTLFWIILTATYVVFQHRL